MERSLIYNGTITAEQFLFYEIRIASKYYLDGTSVEDAIEEIKKNQEEIYEGIKKILLSLSQLSGLLPAWCEAATSGWTLWMMNNSGRNYHRLRLRLQNRSTFMP